ncbi:MAG: transporter associated domain-containing protein [Xanthomonadales bacterium]|nr:transporter associated domain-containing protein [Xanthomonadales bacterium]
MNDDYPSSSGSEHRSWLERLGHALSGGEPRSRAEILSLLKDSQDRHILDDDTFRMVEGAMQVSEMQVRDAMIPRGQMVCLSAETNLAESLTEIVESGHSRFPVIKDDKDEVLGILLAKDVLKHYVSEDTEIDITSLLRPASFIPESKRLNVLLKEFRISRNHMAIVVDEYGGVAGLITIEDVLEEIVGEIDDEYDDEEAPLIRAQEGRILVDALTPIEEVNAYFDTEYGDEEFDTIGGLILGELGRLPEQGERVMLEPIEFEVIQTDSPRLVMLGVWQTDD